MVAYGLGFIPLIKHLKLAYPDVTQHWYVDDAGTLGIFDNIGLHLNFFLNSFRVVDITPNLRKKYIIVHPDNIAARKEFGLRQGFKVCTGARYPGGFIGDDESKRDKLKY